MRNTFYLLLAVILFSSCQSDAKKKIPKEIIPKEKMEKILVDVQLVEGALIYKRSRKEMNDTIRDMYFNLVFKKYDITSQQYMKSLAYYKDNLEVFDEIYTKVLKDLETLQKEN